MRNPDGKGLAFIQGEGGALHGPKKDIKCFALSSRYWTRASRTSVLMTAMSIKPVLGRGWVRVRVQSDTGKGSVRHPFPLPRIHRHMRKLLHMEWVDLVPQWQVKDAAARNANLRLFDIAEVAPPIVHANADEFVDNKIDGNNGIIAVGDIPQQQPHVPLADEGNAVGSGDDDNDDDDDDEDDDNKLAAVTDALEGN